MLNSVDILNREEFVQNLVRLTENLSNSRTSSSFAIDGVWGSGKSFVLDMYEQELRATPNSEKVIDKYFVVRYNCWQNDYYEEPLVAIVATMIDIINRQTKIWGNEEKKKQILGGLKAVGLSLLSIANETIKDKIGFDVWQYIIETKKGVCQGHEEYLKAHEYDMHFIFKQSLQCLQEMLKKIAEDQTVVLLVDELDRCLPEYSIKVLERLHHLTENIDNVLVIMTMDKTRLCQGVRSIFGFEDPEKYLEKFINFSLKLDLGVISEKVIEKYQDFYNMFIPGNFPFDDSIEEFMQAVFEAIDIRTQEQIMKRAMIAHQMLFSEPKDYIFMCMEILLTVLICHYNDMSCFLQDPVVFKAGDRLYDDVFISSSGSKHPAFSEFFKDKFNSLQFRPVYVFSGDATNYALPNDIDLYAAVLYIWYRMHPKSPKLYFSIPQGSTYEFLSEYPNEFKKFIDIISLIK